MERPIKVFDISFSFTHGLWDAVEDVLPVVDTLTDNKADIRLAIASLPMSRVILPTDVRGGKAPVGVVIRVHPVSVFMVRIRLSVTSKPEELVVENTLGVDKMLRHLVVHQGTAAELCQLVLLTPRHSLMDSTEDNGLTVRVLHRHLIAVVVEHGIWRCLVLSVVSGLGNLVDDLLHASDVGANSERNELVGISAFPVRRVATLRRNPGDTKLARRAHDHPVLLLTPQLLVVDGNESARNEHGLTKLVRNVLRLFLSHELTVTEESELLMLVPGQEADVLFIHRHLPVDDSATGLIEDGALLTLILPIVDGRLVEDHLLGLRDHTKH